MIDLIKIVQNIGGGDTQSLRDDRRHIPGDNGRRKMWARRAWTAAMGSCFMSSLDTQHEGNQRVGDPDEGMEGVMEGRNIYGVRAQNDISRSWTVQI